MARIRYGKLVIEFDTDEELDSFLERHSNGGDATPAPGPVQARGGSEAVAPAANGQASRDQTLLRMMINAGASGVETGTVVRLLGGPKGRAVPFAVHEWASRVGLSAGSDDTGACQPIKIGRARGWRLSSGALGAAKAMTEGGTQ